MADTKISQLTAATPLAGTEVVPLVQSGATKKATIDQILAPAAGKGVDFAANTPLAGMTSQLFNLYEEGAYTATITAGSGSYISVAQSLRYTRMGRVINVTGYIAITLNGTASGYLGFTLPFNAVSANDVSFAGRENQVSGLVFGGAPISTSTIAITKYDGTYLGGNGYNFPISFSYSI